MLDHDYLYFEPLKENDVVVILGATHGDFIREHHDEIVRKNVFVINVEPTLEGLVHLSDYIKRAMPENACVVSCAIADEPSIMSMDIRDNLITSTLENRPETNLRYPMRLLYRQKTLVITLDSILSAVDHVDKLFMDIEGSELEVFKGSNLIDKIPYIAVAAYHMRDGEPTHIKLTERLQQTHERVEVTDAPSRNKGENVLFAIGRK